MSNVNDQWSAEDREFANELLASGKLSQEEEISLMDKMEAFDANKAYSDEQAAKTQRWNAAIDRSPLPRAPIQEMPTGFLGFTPDDRQEIGTQDVPTQQNPDLQIKLDNATAQGVDVTTGLRPTIRGAAGLIAFDKNAQWEAVDSALREEYQGIDIPDGVPMVFEDESTGLPMYLRMTEEGKLRPTLVNPPGADTGDIFEFAGELPTFALETLGSIAGATAGTALLPGAGTTGGGVLGAGIGGAISIPARVKLAEMFGVDPKIIEQIKTGNEAAFQAGMSAGGELLGFIALGSISGMRNFLGRQLEVDDLPALEAKIGEKLALQKQVKDKTGQHIELSLGEMTEDADLLTAEANMMNQQAGLTARRMRATEIRRDKAARQALRELATDKPRAPTDDGFRSNEQISESVRDELALKPKTELEGVQLHAQNELTTAEQGAKLDATLDDAYRLRDNIHAHAERMATAEDVAWDNYRSAVRWDPVNRTSDVMIDNSGMTPIREVAQRLENDEQQALLGSLRNSYRGTLENMGFSPNQVDEMVANNELAGLAQPMLDPFHLHMALSQMKRELRRVEAGDTSGGWEAGELRDVIGAIEDTMKQGPMLSRNTGRPLADSTTNSVRAAWEDANATTFKLHNLLDTRNMRFLLETRVRVGPDGTHYEMPNLPAGLLRKRLLKPDDPSMITDALMAVGYDPRIRTALINELRKKHADVTMPDGVWNQSAHNKFMGEYEDHLRVLGVEDDINNVAQFGRMYDDAKNQLANLEASLGQLYGRNVVDPTKPLNIAEEILSNRVTFRQAKNTMDALERVDPRLAGEVRETVVEKLDLDLTASNNMVMNSGRLTDMLRTNRSTLAAVFSPQYVKDLDMLGDILKVMDQSVFRKSTKELMQSPFISVTRSLFGPLSKKQRFLTAVQRVARQSRAGSVSKLLEDPTALRQFLRLRNLKVTDPRYWVIVRNLGLANHLTDEDTDDTFKEYAMSRNLREELQLRFQQFQDGTLRDEQIERQTPRRYGTNL